MHWKLCKVPFFFSCGDSTQGLTAYDKTKLMKYNPAVAFEI